MTTLLLIPFASVIQEKTHEAIRSVLRELFGVLETRYNVSHDSQEILLSLEQDIKNANANIFGEVECMALYQYKKSRRKSLEL